MVVVLNKIELPAPYIIGRFEKHAELKDAVLTAINEHQDCHHLYEEDDAVNISRCDWINGRYDFNRKWVQALIPDLVEHLNKVTAELGYSVFKIQELWFQQYETNAVHGWHVHGSNWTNVYYLELPDGCPKTQFINPYTQSGVQEFDIKEGDILTFPSFVVHRAPINTCTQRKTIISWNMDTELMPGFYKE